MKNYLIGILCIMGMILAGCQSNESNLVEESKEELSIKEVVEADFITSPGKVDGKINFYYMNNQATPYLDFNQFLSKFPQLFGENMKVDRNETDITVIYKYFFNQEIYEDTFKIDFEQNTMYFSRLEKALGNQLKEPKPLEIQLDDYNIELYQNETTKLIPAYLCDFLLSQAWNQNLFFTQNQLYQVSKYNLNFSELVAEYQKNVGQVTEALQQEAIQYLTMLMDNVYGLKNYHQVESYKPMIDELFSQGNHDENLATFIAELNDAHSGITFGSESLKEFYVQSTLNNEYHQKFNQAFQDNMCLNQKEAIVNYRDDVIYMDYRTFNTRDEEKYKQVLEESEGKTIILDLRCNGGGYVDSMKDLLDFLSNDPVTYYTADLQGALYETTTSSRVSSNNYILLTSSYTFSAANAFTNTFKELNLGTIIGEKTGGGISFVGCFALPDGSLIDLSSSSLMVNSKGEPIEDGIEPDIPLAFTPDMDIKETILHIIDQQD